MKKLVATTVFVAALAVAGAPAQDLFHAVEGAGKWVGKHVATASKDVAKSTKKIAVKAKDMVYKKK